jgi:hypothetical protein
MHAEEILTHCLHGTHTSISSPHHTRSNKQGQAQMACMSAPTSSENEWMILRSYPTLYVWQGRVSSFFPCPAHLPMWLQCMHSLIFLASYTNACQCSVAAQINNSDEHGMYTCRAPVCLQLHTATYVYINCTLLWKKILLHLVRVCKHIYS